MTTARTTAVDLFVCCVDAIQRGELIHRSSSRDKEFHFQDWVAARLDEAHIRHDAAGRNSYPDFTLVDTPEGYEVKGLAWPGREANYDANSQVPSGYHNGRQVFYVFGRYPASEADNDYPVIDLVICHGDFLNAKHDYVHKNKNVKGFGSYGDIIIRDRKMYVAPTPFALTRGTTGQRTLILPSGIQADDRVEIAGGLVRVEATQLVVGYTFDLSTNTLTPEYEPNPSAGAEHGFVAYRAVGAGSETIRGVDTATVVEEVAAETDDD